MRYIAAIMGLLLASLPAFSLNNKTILAQLNQEMSLLGFLPGAVQATAPTRLKIIYLPDGALARWNPKTNTFEISKAHWKQAPNARCLLPLFVHENMHSHFVKQARELGFAWPVTLQDETVALYYQLMTEQTQADYAQTCTVWRAELTPIRQALAAQNWTEFEQAVYAHYTQFKGPALPPPPFVQPWTSHAQTDDKLMFYQHTYTLRRRTLSAEKFWHKGGSWLRMSPEALTQALQDPHYPLYRQLLVQSLGALKP